MKTNKTLRTWLAASFLLLAVPHGMAQTNWEKVEKLLNDGSPKSAYSQAETVFKKTNSSPDLLTAAWYMARASAQYQEDCFESSEARFRQILPRLEAPERAVCYAFLGEPDMALADEEVLKRTPSDRILRFCEKTKSEGINITPTVYDVVVRQIINGSGYRREWFQRLVDFHSGDAEELRICLDLELLNVTSREQDLIQSYINKYRGSKNPMVTDFYFFMADYLERWKRYVEAVAYCDTAIALAPKSSGGANCANLKNQICAARIIFPYSYNNPSAIPGRWSLHHLRYCNLNRLFFAVYPLEGEEPVSLSKLSKPLKQWQLEVEDDGSHKEKAIYFEIPPLPAGRYLLVVTPDEKLKGSECAYLEFFCTDMMVNLTSGSTIQLFNALNGTPIVGQRVDFYSPGRLHNEVLHDSAYTDADGRAEYADAAGRFSLKIMRDGYLYKKSMFGYFHNFYEREMEMHVELLGDRPVYRLGDTLHFALLCHENDGVNGRVAPNVQGCVSLHDPHGNVIDSLAFVADEHGMMSGSFVIPSDGRAGYWIVYCRIPQEETEDISASMRVRVEEYKPPKFMVSLDDLSDSDFKAPDFGEPYTIRGIARAYSGATLSGAQVRYTIERSSWSMHSGIVASDTLEVASDGTFNITFTPCPDSSDDLSRKDGYDYYVHVEVTDLNGETQEARAHFHVGSQKFSLYLDGIESEVSQLSSVGYVLTAGYYRPVKGTVTVSVQRLAAAPPLLHHPVVSSDNDIRTTFSREQFSVHFPGFAYPTDHYYYESRAVEWSCEVRHEADGVSWNQTVSLPKGLKSGLYRIVATIDDVSDTAYTLLTLPDERHVQTEDLLWYDLSDSVCEVGDRLVLRYASAFDDVNVFYSLIGPDGVERDHRWLSAGTEIKQFSIPVDTSLLGGFMVWVVAVKNGVTNHESRTVRVPFSHKKINVDISTFRDKLQPGQQEEWTIKVTDATSANSSLPTRRSSLIMTMFDDALSSYASIDDNWHFYPWRGGYDDYETFSWEIPSHNATSYNAFSKSKKLVGDSPDLQKLVFKRDFLFSMNRGRSNLYYSSDSNGTAASQGVLKGVIIDSKTEELLPFVHIVVNQNGKQVADATTDFDGVFTIKPLREGSYDVNISYVGYYRFVRAGVRVKSSVVTMLDIQLAPFATNLDEVVIMEQKMPTIELNRAESGERMAKNAVVASVGGMAYSVADVPSVPIQPVQLRSNLSPLAFFVADLHTDSTGTATYRFRVPDLLTRWKIKGLAFTDDLKIGTFDKTLVTQRSLMVQPNIPRFLRQGDSIVMMAKVMNLTDTARKVRVMFTLNNPNTPNNPNNLITKIYQVVDVPAQGSKQVTFPFHNLPRDLYVATYEITAQTCDEHGPQYSDGERGQIPVLSNRQAVTLSQPIYINGAGEKTYRFNISPSTSTATPQFLGAELVSNPAWLAIKAMPYLNDMENPSNLFLANRLYVNTLASSILKDFKGLKDISALSDTSNTRLKINDDIKQTLIESTPWLRDAESEMEQRKAIANYFDSSRMAEEFSTLTSQLSMRQNDDGGWSWIHGGESSLWVTRQILKKLVTLKSEPVTENALAYVDRVEKLNYDKYVKPHLKKGYQWSPDNIDYLYTRSFYGKGHTEAYRFYYKNALKNYRQYNNLYTQAQLALVFHRHGDRKAARDIIRRLKEKCLESDEMGMYWRDNRSGWFWYERPVETQALLIQAFSEITPRDTAAIALMQQWLLKQKQATHWGNDRATVEAIKSLTLSGNAVDTSNAEPTLTVCGMPLSNPSEGLEGYRSQRWTNASLDSVIALGDSTVTIRKETPGIAWGAVYFQYTDDMDKVPSTESGISIRRTYLPAGNWKVGERVKVRIEISCDRTMEYLELIDGRPSCVEPVSTRSGWMWNQGLRYYVEVKNSATHCYINRLEKGDYIVEYDAFVTNPGIFLAPPSVIQCLYAPEFRATSPASRLAVQK